MVTTKDIAKRAGVSQTTVSRVLNKSDKVRPETRDRVMAALKGYVPHAQARAMRTNRTETIGVVASQITNPYFPELIEAIYAAARDRDLRMLLWSDSAAAAAAVDGVRRGLVDGVCYTSAVTGDPGLQELMSLESPIVLVNRGLASGAVDQVMSNSEQIGRLAAAYVIASSRSRVAMIAGPSDIVGIDERRDAFRNALQQSGLTLPGAWDRQGALTYVSGQALADQLCEDGVPEVIFCGNDLMAFGAMSALARRGLSVPEDVWVIGIDDLPMASWDVFSLTTIRQPIRVLAEHALDLLTRRINGETFAPVRESVDVELLVRGSTAGFSGPRWRGRTTAAG
jgi:LacI family transcriptional regulator